MDSNLINTILTVVLIPILPIITGYLIALLKKKTADIESKINNETANKYISIAESTIETCVTAVSQTFVETLKKNGTFDSASQAEAFEMCKQRIFSILSDEVKSTLSDLHGDLNAYIDSKIEFYVNINKKAQARFINYELPI